MKRIHKASGENWWFGQQMGELSWRERKTISQDGKVLSFLSSTHMLILPPSLSHKHSSANG